jgi:STE24 endopeptidase
MPATELKLLLYCLVFILSSLAIAPGRAQEQNVERTTELPAHTDGAGARGALEREPVAVPEPSERAHQFYRSGNWLWVFDHVWTLLLLAGLAFSGFSARLRSLAQRLGQMANRDVTDKSLESMKEMKALRELDFSDMQVKYRLLSQLRAGPHGGFLTIVLYVIMYLAIVFLVDLPLSYFQGFVRPHAYGLSNQTVGRWFGNSVISLGIEMAGGVAFAWVPYLLLARSPRRWWLYTAMLSVPFLFGIMLIAPIWIDPLYNTFGPMKNKTLERSILALAERAGIDGSRVFEVDKSVDTKAVNAYVKGVLATKRIVLWDTLIAKLDEPELLFVMGHEMGHYVLGHVVRSILLSAVVTLAGLFLVDSLGRRLVARYSHRLGFDRLSDVASVPLLLMLMEVAFLLLSPVALAYSRYQEHEADRFALELTRTNYFGARSFVKLQRENLSIPRPGPVFKLLRASHPSIGERIDFCNTYHPWISNSKVGTQKDPTSGRAPER